MCKKFITLLLLIISYNLYACDKHIVPEALSAGWISEEQKDAHVFATLSTVDEGSTPSSRMIEVKVNPDNEVTFFTHRNTRKVSHIANSPYVSMNMWLSKVSSQLTIDGEAVALDRSTLEQHWMKMPYRMQIKFISSDHKSKISSSTQLKDKLEHNNSRFKEVVPMPKEFVGYKIKPIRYEFYTLRAGDFPEKIVAIKSVSGWDISRREP